MTGEHDDTFDPPRKRDEAKRVIRQVLHRVRNPLAASHLEVQLARRAHVALSEAIESGNHAAILRELQTLSEALEGVEQSIFETAARMDDVEGEL